MRISSASSKILFQSFTIHCSASRIEVFNIIEQFQILTSTPNRLRSLKIDCHNHQPASKYSYMPSSKIQTERYKSKNRCLSLLPQRSHRSNHPSSPVAHCESKLSIPSTIFKSPHQDQTGFASIESNQHNESGGESLILRPLASEARANNVSDVHGVDNQK